MDKKQRDMTALMKTTGSFYSNIINISWNQIEFVLFFSQAPRNVAGHVDTIRVYMHPVNAKSLLEILKGTMNEYEKKFGKIKGRIRIKHTKEEGIEVA